MAAIAVALLALAVSSGTSAAVGTTYVVDTTDGTTDGLCGGSSDCSLGDAIQAANANAGLDTVAFALPLPPYTIEIDASTSLPGVTDPIVIDGTTQPGWLAAPIVELRGDGIGFPFSLPGLTLRAGPSVVRGLVINGFDQAAIHIVAGNNHRIVGNYIGTNLAGTGAAGGSMGISVFGGTEHEIGGASSLDRNVISGSGTNVHIQTSGVSIQGNYIGTDATGEVALGGSNGVVTVNSSNHVIGAAGQTHGNLISGHSARGIQVGGSGSAGHRIVGNRVGTDKNGVEPLPNFDGIAVSGADTTVSSNLISGNLDGGLEIEGCLIGDCLGVIVQGNLIGVDATGTKALGNGTFGIATSGADGVVIGGAAPGHGNVISANGANGATQSSGIWFFNSARRHRIQGNLIGLGVDGTPLGNLGYGIGCCGAFAESRDNVIGGTAPGEGNQIAYNTRDGIRVTGASPSGTHAAIVGNSIHSNGRLGIDLEVFGPTVNDPGDVDEGANDVQNFPVIRRVTSNGGQTLADVVFSSTPASDFRLEFFRNTSCNQPTPLSPSSWFGEGQAFVAAQHVTTDSAGNWSGTVAWSAETAVTEVITSTATRFAAPGVSLVGSTSEFSECLADLSIAKIDEPDPVAIGAPLTYTIEILNDGPAPASDVHVTDTLPPGVTVTSITPSQGSCSQLSSTVTCLLGAIGRDGSAEITIVLDPGSVMRTITNTAEVSSELRDPDASDNTASATTDVVAVQPATIIVRKVTVPSPDPTDTSFGLAAGGGLSPASFGLKNGESRTFANLIPSASYSLTETTPEGWDLVSATCSDGSPASNIDLSPDETVTCTFTNRRRGTIIVRKVTDPAPDPGDTSFGFTAGGGLSPASFSLKNGESRMFANLVPQAGYSLAETTPTSGWDLTSATCSDGSPTVNVDVAAGETVTCTFTNTKRGSFTLKKTTDGGVDSSKDILFVLTGAGLPSAGIMRSTFDDQDGVLDFGTGNLIAGQTYTACESPVPAGFTSFWKLDGVIVTPYNPDATGTPPEDLGTRCYDFSVAAGQARAVEVDNSHPGGDPRTIGYWKNWNRCTSGNQAATAQKNGGAAAGFFIVEDLVPQLVGDLSVTSCQQAIKLLSKQDPAGKNKASDAAYELASQLLAARFNLAAGAETCAAVQQAGLNGQTLLDLINFSGSGDYLGSKSKDARRPTAVSLAATLDRYNNGNLC